MSRVGLLRVGHIDPRAADVHGDYLDLYTGLLGPCGIELVEFGCDEGDLPASLDDLDGWLLSPSRLSAYDDVPWLADVEDLLRRAVAEERPLVGICFGHQLLAQCLGGEVQRAEGGWTIGVQSYDLEAAPWWIDPPRQRIDLIASHQDQVTRLPDGAELLASGPGCANGGMLIGERAWTLQTHPEFTPALADDLLAGRVDLLGEAVIEQARRSLSRPIDREVVAGWMARFFGD